MIFVAGQMNMPPEIMDDFEKDVKAMRPKVLTEKGCHHYSLLTEDRGTGLINVVEVWDDDDALMEHFTQPWIVEFMEKYAAQIQNSTVKIYDVAGVRDLPSH